VGEAGVAGEVEPGLHEAPGHALDVPLGGGDAPAALPEGFERRLHPERERVRADREHQREERVGQLAGLLQVGPREAELREVAVEAGVVPEGERDGLFGGQAVVERDPARHGRRLGRPLRPDGVAGASGEVAGDPRVVVGRARAAEGEEGDGRQAVHRGAHPIGRT
jgi:hypothetical protein